MKKHLSDPSAVIWLQTAYLGDIVLTFGAARALKVLRPGVRQYLITTPQGVELQGPLDLFAAAIPLDKKIPRARSFMHVLRAVKALKLERSSTVILQVHGSLRSFLLAEALGFKRIAYSGRFSHIFSPLIPHGVRVQRVMALHESQRIKLLLEPLGLSRVRTFVLGAEVCDAQQRRDLMSHHPFPQLDAVRAAGGFLVALVPGSQGQAKRWPVAYYADVARWLIEQGIFVVVVGGKAEQSLGAAIKDFLTSGEEASDLFCDLTGKTSLGELWGLYARFDLVVGSDSSSTHLSSALGVPCFVLYGATSPALGFVPLSPGSETFGVQHLPCRPCSAHGLHPCPLKHFRCMKELKPVVLIESLKNFFHQKSRSSS